MKINKYGKRKDTYPCVYTHTHAHIYIHSQTVKPQKRQQLWHAAGLLVLLRLAFLLAAEMTCKQQLLLTNAFTVVKVNQVQIKVMYSLFLSLFFCFKGTDQHL